LLYLFDDDKFLFASEMKGILSYGIEKTLDFASLYTYLQLNYIPAPDTIFKSVKKLMPGQYLKVRNKQMAVASYYEIPFHCDPQKELPYDRAKSKLKELLEASVTRR